jgi:ParB family transcriptional regulator, chromosome partitioning protein
MNAKRQALGRGLTALLTDASTDVTGKVTVPVNAISEIPLNEIEANPFQPREDFNEDQLDKLVESIKLHGIIQPVSVRKIGYGKYQLISGERRTRASIRAGMKTIPAFVRVSDDQGMLELSLTENLMRDDLNPIEEALGYRRLIEECNLKQDEVASRIGKDRSSITNFLRLLKLPEEIQIALKNRQITMGHARSLLGIDDPMLQLDVLKHILQDDLTVRQIEGIVKDIKIKKSRKGRKVKDTVVMNEFHESLAEKLADLYHTTVILKPKGKSRGEIIISYKSEDDLKRIFAIIDNQSI